MAESNRDLLVQTRQRVDKLLTQMREQRRELSHSTKLDRKAIAEGIVAMDAMIEALEKIAAETDRAIEKRVE